MKTVTLKIETEIEEMTSGRNIATMLRMAANRVDRSGNLKDQNGSIIDTRNNTESGRWNITMR